MLVAGDDNPSGERHAFDDIKLPVLAVSDESAAHPDREPLQNPRSVGVRVLSAQRLWRESCSGRRCAGRAQLAPSGGLGA